MKGPILVLTALLPIYIANCAEVFHPPRLANTKSVCSNHSKVESAICELGLVMLRSENVATHETRHQNIMTLSNIRDCCSNSTLPRNTQRRRLHRPLLFILSEKQEEDHDAGANCSKEFHNLYSSTNTVRTIKMRTVKRAGHVGCIREVINAYETLVGKPGMENTTWEKYLILHKCDMKAWTGFT